MHHPQQFHGYPSPTLVPGVGTQIVPWAASPVTYNQKVALNLGITQLIIGIICFISNIILILLSKFWELNHRSSKLDHEGTSSWEPYHERTMFWELYHEGSRSWKLNHVGYGIWGGVIFFVAGYLCLLSGKNEQQKCLIVATYVMSIIAACIAPLVFILGITDLFSPHSFIIPIMKIIYWIIPLFSIPELILAISSSVFCCKRYCCCSDNVQTVMAYNPATQQMMSVAVVQDAVISHQTGLSQNHLPGQPYQYPNQPYLYPNQQNQYPNQQNQYPNQQNQYPSKLNQYPNQPSQNPDEFHESIDLPKNQ